MMLAKRNLNKGRKLLSITLSVLLGLSLCTWLIPLRVHAEDTPIPDDGTVKNTVPVSLTYQGQAVDLSRAYLIRTDTEEDTAYLLEAFNTGALVPAGTYSIYLPDIETGSDILLQGAALEVKENIPIAFTADYFCIRFIDSDGTTLLSKQLIASGKAFTPPTAPEYSGYDWIGWADAPQGGIVNLPLEIDRDYTFYGIWNETPMSVSDPEPTQGPAEKPTEKPAENPPTHSHIYEWKSDDKEHWQECTSTDGSCDAKEIERAAHNFGEGIITQEPTKTAEGEKAFKCDACGYTKKEIIAKLPHEHIYTWKSDSKEHWQECTSTDSSCDAKEIKRSAHNFDQGTVTKEATEDAEGEKVFQCQTCGYTRTEVVPKLPHTHKYGTEWKNDDTSHWHECTCGSRFDVRPHTAGDWITDQNATVSTEGSRHKECTDCKKVMETEAIARLTPPEITAGAGQIFHSGSKRDLVITCSGKLENLTGVYVDNQSVDKSNYTLASGSTILTLKADYLDSLGSGPHTVKLAYSDGTSAETQFTIQKTGAVKTADTTNYIPLVILLILSVGVLIITTVIRKKEFKE